MRHKTARIFVVCSLALAMCGALSTVHAAPQIGKPAPDFALKDIYGKLYKLSEFKGKVVVLEWINQDCPIWRGKAAQLNETYKKLLAPKSRPGVPVKKLRSDVVWLCIDSTHYMTGERNRAFFVLNGIAKPVLMDPDGKVGKAYDARTTPHMFVIDKNGILVYDGACDNARSRKKGAELVDYVAQAVEAVLAGKPVPTPKTNPYGCSVKYARR